jgi:hypothetical protein
MRVYRTFPPVAPTSRPEENKFSQFRKGLTPFEPVLVITGILTVISSVVLFFVAARQFQLMVLVEKTKVYPAVATEDLSLPLEYKGTPAHTVWVATIKIINFGSSSIGEQGSLWTLHVSCPDAETVLVIEEPAVIPDSTVWSLLKQNDPNIVSLSLGVLQPRAEITLYTMVTNPKKPYVRFTAQSSLPGLPKPEIGDSLIERLSERFFPVAALSSLVVVAIIFVMSIRQEMSANAGLFKKLFNVGLLFVVVSVVWIFSTVVLAWGLGAIAWVLLRAPSAYDMVLQWLQSL